jgi:hypothetical protein
LSVRFANVIEQAYKKTGRKVVVLIDEYDKPLISSMDNHDLNTEMRNILKGFYGVLTAEDALALINSKDYAIPYTADQRKLVKIGVEFSQIEKGIKRWLIEKALT